VSKYQGRQKAGKTSLHVLELLIRSVDSSSVASSPISAIQNIDELLDLNSLLDAPQSSQVVTRSPETLLGGRASQSLFLSAWGMMPVALDSEHAGYVPETAQLGDEVVVSYGVKAPLVIRKVDEKFYRIIGPAHVCGVMQGEVVITIAPGQTYVLV
jgi:hypothetical protein